MGVAPLATAGRSFCEPRMMDENKEEEVRDSKGKFDGSRGVLNMEEPKAMGFPVWICQFLPNFGWLFLSTGGFSRKELTRLKVAGFPNF